VDKVSRERRSEIMSHIRSKGMVPELIVRRLIHGMGYRYRLHRVDLPGKPDLVFPGRSKVIFVHGCFWHQHGHPKCPISRQPKSRRFYWGPKLKRNKERDRAHIRKLRHLGWGVLVVWECQVSNLGTLRRRVARFLGR
jgi:DNA mismatch endonuclease (patch repair protein)